MIAELKNSKYSTMQEDAVDTDAAATVPSTITSSKDERISNIVSASASVGGAATAVTHLQPHHVVLKDESENSCGASESAQTNYKRKLMFALGRNDGDDVGSAGDGASTGAGSVVGILEKDIMEMADITQPACKKPKLCEEKEQMFEQFQPWALKTYGDQAKTKTITLRKKARILKALEGKEHSRPDSSKFRFWVKSKAFTTKKPECFKNAAEYPASSNTEYPNNIDLYVASTTKDFGQRTYRKVAVVEEFFNIIYNIHVEMGGRSGRHAGQKRTYRIITETYAFLPREAVTRFLSACPECKKNLRPLSPGRSTADEEIPNESSTEIDAMQNEISMEIPKTPTPTPIPTQFKPESTILKESKRKSHNQSPIVPKQYSEPVFTPPSVLQKIRVNPTLQQQSSFAPEPIRNTAPVASAGAPMNFGMLNRESLVRYYDFMRRLYGQSIPTPSPTQIVPEKTELEVEPVTPIQPEVIDLRTDDEPSTSTATVAMHSASVLEAPPQVCAINLSKTISREVKFEEPQESPTKLNIRNQKPITLGYEYVSAFPELDEEPQMELDLRKVKPSSSRYLSEPELDYPSQLDLRMRPTTSKYLSLSTPRPEERDHQLDLRKLKPITSTYLQLTRSMGLSDADALQLDHLEPQMPSQPAPDTASDGNPEDPYAGLMKDADKLKLMLLAWNYQNSNAVRNGTEGPDLGVVGGLWAQYQNALAQNVTKMETSISPVPRPEESSPMETQDETNSSGQKDEDEGSEDDLDDKLDQQAHDPERLKAFNMFVRLFVDENLDRIIPISKQPKEKIQAIIDSCSRQFPEFSERSRKRIRTYLKSCRRNKKAREGWDNTTRPTPAHLTSVQAEQILAIACENESMNAKRMRIGLDPITQALPLTTTTSSTSTAVTSDSATTSTPFTSGFRSTPNPTTSESDVLAPITTSTQGASSSARSSPLALSTTSVSQPIGGGGNGLSNGNTTVTSVSAIPASSPLYRPTDFTSPSSTSPYAARTPTYPSYFPAANATPTDLSMKPSAVQQPTQSITSTAAATSSSLSPNARPPPPLVTHKLSANEITAARQVITAYRESAAFLLRTADQVEQLLVQQQ